MKSLQFYAILKEISTKEEIIDLLKTYRISDAPCIKGAKASIRLEEYFFRLKRHNYNNN